MNAPRHPDGMRRQDPSAAARALGWFSIGLGLVELLAPGRVARAIGQRGHDRVVRAYGVRELTTGIGLLTTREPGPWLWGRVAGDLMDAATLATRRQPAAAGRRRVSMALAAVAAVTVVDVACAAASRQQANLRLAGVPDYSKRSGFPKPPDAMRGTAWGASHATGGVGAWRAITGSKTPD